VLEPGPLAVQANMMQTRVVILSAHSLFAEGIARRLQEYLQLAKLEIVDPRHLDAMAQISAARPSIVILDVTDSKVTQFCPLSNLLLSFPELRVICLDPQQDQIQVVTGEKRKAVEVRDLAEVIEQSI
jgi:DNA-binding NarL/FixJ family response regulator